MAESLPSNLTVKDASGGSGAMARAKMHAAAAGQIVQIPAEGTTSAPVYIKFKLRR